jgi:DhnA family fructose-bisphosphate aldolase class Ia
VSGVDDAGRTGGSLRTPALVLAADHRARGVMTIERYADYLRAAREALPHCDGILATAQPLCDLARAGALRPDQRTYLSVNRTGLAGSAFELDDRLVASVGRAADDGWSGVKLMTRIDYADPAGAAALELLGRVLEDARARHLEALIEPIVWRDGGMSRVTDDIVMAAVIAHDLGAPLLKVPVPDAPPGRRRVDAVGRIVASVGVPVLFLGGPHRRDGGDGVADEGRDVMAGGGAGLAVGRAILEEPSPSAAAAQLAEIVHAG